MIRISINKLISQRKPVLIVVFIFLLLLFLLSINNFLIRKTEPLTGSVNPSTVGESWVNYTNKKYGFSIDFPSTWKISEHLIDANPIINIYKPTFNTKKPPYDHFDEIANVSIFPNGVATEPLIGEINDESKIKLGNESREIKNYILENGEIWASGITFKNPPSTWKSWGFIWFRSEIKNLKQSCERSGIEIDIIECNPFGGDVFVRRGEVNEEVRNIQIKILESFKFLE